MKKIKSISVYDRYDIKNFLIENGLLEKRDQKYYEKFISNDTDHNNYSVYFFEFPESIEDERYEEYKIPIDCAERLQDMFSLLQKEEFSNASRIKIYLSW